MRCTTLTICSLMLVSGLAAQQRGGRGAGNMIPPLEESGFRQIFDGKSLTGWDCDPKFWRVENGILTGETTAEHQPEVNIFCIWRGGQPGDFELKLQYRLS